eukprot:5924538-Ditylum_brightwellii.AAC.1
MLIASFSFHPVLFATFCAAAAAAGVVSTATLTGSSVSSLVLCLIPQSNTGMGVHNDGLLDDETTFVETCHSKRVAFTSK